MSDESLVKTDPPGGLVEEGERGGRGEGGEGGGRRAGKFRVSVTVRDGEGGGNEGTFRRAGFQKRASRVSLNVCQMANGQSSMLGQLSGAGPTLGTTVTPPTVVRS